MSATFAEFTTDDVPACERGDYWGRQVLQRMTIASSSHRQDFTARLRRLRGAAGDFWDHFSDEIPVARDDVRCRRDGGDEIYVGMLLDGTSDVSQAGHDHRLEPGRLYVVDMGRPVRAHWTRHREVAIVLRRRHAAAQLGRPLDELAGRVLPRQGMTELLASHLRLLAFGLPALTAQERSVALETAIAMTCSALHSGLTAGAEDTSPGLKAAARLIIRRRYADPELSPERIAALLGCSRARLYRAFAGETHSIAHLIREVRLSRARDMLTHAAADETITAIAERCGFQDLSSFSRMFKERFAMRPQQLRDELRAASSGHARPGSR
ncbi:MAG: helix-turn-helix domain-containing protein [Pseudomonadota bacterium]